MKLRYVNALSRFLVLILFIALTSCKSNDKKDFLINLLSEGLKNSTANVVENNNTLYDALEEDLLKPESRYKAVIWQPKAALLKKISDSIILYTNKMKDGVLEQEKWKQLYAELKLYKSKLNAIDSLLNKQFKDEISKITKSFDSLNERKEDVFNLVKDISISNAHAFLDELQNHIRLIENDLLTFCYLNIPQYSDMHYTKFSIIWGATALHYKNGDSLEMYAGMGAFSTRSNPKIQIEGKDMDVDFEGRAVYKEQISGRPGKYYRQIKIDYTNDDGKRVTLRKKIGFVIDK